MKSFNNEAIKFLASELALARETYEHAVVLLAKKNKEIKMLKSEIQKLKKEQQNGNE